MPNVQDMLARVPRPAMRWSRLLGLGAVVGVLGGLAAAGLEWGLHQGSHLLVGRYAPYLGQPEVLKFGWWVLLLPAIGGLVSGIVTRLMCPLATGHGTDVLVRAFHRQMGELPLKAPLIKGVAMVGVISCGGSAGPEGPIAALGAALGSTVGRLFQLTARERRVLLVAGCAAGVGAIFKCPLGGALFAASILYREEDFEAEAIAPAFIASVIGYTVFISLFGTGNYMWEHEENLAFSSAIELLPYAVLGPLCALASIFFSICLRTVEKRIVPWSRLPRWFAPAIGGLAVGGLACLLPQVMDGRYHFIENTMQGFGGQGMAIGWWVCLFAAVVVAKCIATALTVGSGASGGVLGPSVFIGGAVGAFLGAALLALSPELLAANPQLQASLIPVAMGGVLAVTMRTPLAAIVMVSEMTGSYGLIVPLMLVCISAYVIGRRWGLNHEQVQTSAESPAHAADAIVHMLETWRVDDVMESDWAETISPNTPLREMVGQIKPGTQPVFAVVRDDELVGLVSVADIRRIMEEPGMADVVIAADMMTEKLTTVRPDRDVYHALGELRHSGFHALPVVSHDKRTGRDRWLGMLTRERVFETIRVALAEKQKDVLREHVGLEAIEQEGQLQQLVMGVSPMQKSLIQRLFVPIDVVGKSLRESDFRMKYNIQVIAIEQSDGSLRCPPDLDAPLETGQRLLAIVWD